MIALKKISHRKKNLPPWLHFFFFFSSLSLLLPPSLFQFLAVCPLPLYLYVSTPLGHTSKNFPALRGQKGRGKGEEKRGRKKEEKENIITYNFRRPSRRAVVVVKARFWLPFPYIQLPLFNILSIHSHSLVVGVFFTSRFFFLQLRGSNSARAIYNIHMFLRNRYILCNH